LGHLKKHIVSMIGGDALENDQYVRMVSRRHYDRVMGLIDPEKVVFGGKGNPETLHIQPTIMDGVTAQDAVMQEEIFGPVLPVIAYDSIDEAVEFVRSREHPLALYLFSEDKTTQERFLRSVPFGGGCLNDTIIHLATSRMGFGGVGQSGMGAYHGKKSFETFSHEKSVVSKSTWMDLPVRYMPYSDVKDRLLRLFLR
ncbi:MAG: aldehyde dehydrogenase family protein, partial [Clostridia bacterium]|nr:aldehyde dehydrogenase family protein [Clostridia bacterium]